nr:SAM-dependent methyltransferase [Planosporangium mesophilum]
MPTWVPEGVNVTVPNAARVYDYALGGYHNFTVDRDFLHQAEAMMPGLVPMAHANRAYLGRVVRWLAAAGVRQFLDIGSGIPTLGNVHEVAQAAAPDSRVMYVDIDPVAVAHGRAILADNPRATAIEGDLRRPADILNHPEALNLLDLSEPVAVLLNAVLHFVSDDEDPAGIVASIRDALVSGSYFAVSHVAPSGGYDTEEESLRRLYERTPTPFYLRTPDQVASILNGLEIVDPGVVSILDWHPDPEEEADDRPELAVLGAVGRKP